MKALDRNDAVEIVKAALAGGALRLVEGRNIDPARDARYVVTLMALLTGERSLPDQAGTTTDPRL